MTLPYRLCFSAMAFLVAPLMCSAQSTGQSAMGSGGATGGVAGGSAVGGAQGANSAGAASGGGPNTSPVLPAGGRYASPQTSRLQSNQLNGPSGGNSTSNYGTNGAVPSQVQRTRQRFGNAATPRTTLQGESGSTQFPAGGQTFDNGTGQTVRPNRTYRSDLGAWETTGPFQPGSNVNPSTSTTSGVTGMTGGRRLNAGSTDALGDDVAPLSPLGTRAGGAMLNPQGAVQNGAATVQSGVQAVQGAANSSVPSSFDNSLVPPNSSARLPVVSGAAASSYAAADDTGASPSFNFYGGNPARRPQFGITMSANFSGSGARVSRVVPNSPAARAGLRPGDVITSFNGQGVMSHQDVLAAAELVQPQELVEVLAWRHSQTIPLTMTAAVLPTRTEGNFDPDQSSASDTQDRLIRIERMIGELQAEMQQNRR
jgi:hypothetical protein